MPNPELAVVVKMQDMFTKSLGGMGKATESFGKTAVDSFKRLGTSFKSITDKALNLKTAIIGFATGAVVKGIADLSAKSEALRSSFDGLAKSIGSTSEEALQKLRRASKNTASDLDLIVSANKAIMLGAARSSDDLEQMAYAARRLGAAMGVDAAKALEYFVVGLARQSIPILDNIGITFKLEDAYSQMADKLNVKAEELTDDQRKGAFSAMLWDKARERMKALGEDVETVGIKFGRFSAAWDNLKEKVVSSGLGDALADMADALKDLATNKLIVGGLQAIARVLRTIAGAAKDTADRLKEIPDLIARTARTSSTYQFFGQVNKDVKSGTWWLERYKSGVYDFPRIQQEYRAGEISKGEYEAIVNLERQAMLTPKAYKNLQRQEMSEGLNDIVSGFSAATKPVDFGSETTTAKRLYMSGEDWLRRFRAEHQTMGNDVVSVWEAISRGASGYLNNISDRMSDVKATTIRAFEDLEYAIGDVFFDGLTGKMKSFKEYLTSFLTDISRTISQFLARSAMQGLMEAGSSAIGSLFSSGKFATVSELGWSTHASGGVFDKAHVGVIGEAGTEAVIPMPDGKNVGVKLLGGGGQPAINVVIQTNDVDSFRRSLHRVKRDVLSIWREGVAQDSGLRGTMKAAMS